MSDADKPYEPTMVDKIAGGILAVIASILSAGVVLCLIMAALAAFGLFFF